MSVIRWKYFAFDALLTGVALSMIFTGCTKEQSEFILADLTIGTIGFNDNRASVTVPVNPVMVATFNCEVEDASAVPGSISLIQDYDHAVIGTTITANENTITVVANEPLCTGALYILRISDRIKSEAGQALRASSWSFTTTGTFAPSGSFAYWDFEDGGQSQPGSKKPSADGIIGMAYTASRNSAAGKAATFDGDRSIIEIPDASGLMNTRDFTLGFWVKTNSEGHFDSDGNPAGYFVMGLAAFFGFQFEIAADFSWCNFTARYEVMGGIPVSEDLLFPGDGKTKDNGGWQGLEFCKDLTGSGGVAGLLKDKWACIVCTFESSSKRASMYINGEKMKVLNFNLWPVKDTRHNISGLWYDGNAPETLDELAFGFLQSRGGTFLDCHPRYGYNFPTANHFKGQLDDVRIYHKALTGTEIQLMFNSEK